MVTRKSKQKGWSGGQTSPIHNNNLVIKGNDYLANFPSTQV